MDHKFAIVRIWDPIVRYHYSQAALQFYIIQTEVKKSEIANIYIKAAKATKSSRAPQIVDQQSEFDPLPQVLNKALVYFRHRWSFLRIPFPAIANQGPKIISDFRWFWTTRPIAPKQSNYKRKILRPVEEGFLARINLQWLSVYFRYAN